MDVFEAIWSRRSIRAFTDERVLDEEITMVIDAARWAPSAGNIQPWEFVVVRNPETKQRLSVAALRERFIESAAVIIIVCANQSRSKRGYGSRGKDLYCIQDTAAATQNMLLAAFALGLASCWVGAFREEEVKKIVKLPSDVRPLAIVAMGHAAEEPSARSRRSLSEIVHRETYRGKSI